MRAFLRLLIRGYQLLVSPMLGPRCRFHPSCSHYALEAVERHGAARGAWLALRRLLRCHPLHPGGYDPVPAAKAQPLAMAHPDSAPRSTRALTGPPKRAAQAPHATQS